MVPAWVNVVSLRRAGDPLHLRYATHCGISAHLDKQFLRDWLPYKRLPLIAGRIRRSSLVFLISPSSPHLWEHCCAGCKLPIQVLFPANEPPTAELVSALKHADATAATMPKSLDAFISKANGENDAQMAGFMLKIAAIILSSYQEVRCSISQLSVFHYHRRQAADYLIRTIISHALSLQKLVLSSKSSFWSCRAGIGCCLEQAW